MRCYNVSSMHKHIHRKIPRKGKREEKWESESVNEKRKKPSKTQPSEKCVLWFLKATFHSILLNVFHFRFFFAFHQNQNSLHISSFDHMHTLFYLVNTQFQSQVTCFQFNFHLFEMTSKYVEHELHDYIILLNASNFRMVFLGLRYGIP